MYHFTFEELQRFQRFVRSLGFVKTNEHLYRAENLLEYFPREEVIECFSIAAKKRIFSIDYVVGILNNREEQRMKETRFEDGETLFDKVNRIANIKTLEDHKRELERLELMGLDRFEIVEAPVFGSSEV